MRKITSITLFFLIIFSLPLGMLPAMSAPKTDIKGLIREYHELLDLRVRKGHDVSKAEELDRQSRTAMENGNPELAAKFLEAAIDTLKALGDVIVSNIADSHSSTSIAKPVSTIPKSLNSPFGFRMTNIADRPVMPGGKLSPGIDTISGVAETGIAWVHYDRLFVWDRIEAQKGLYDWSRTDYVVQETYKRGVNIVATVMAFNKSDGAGRGYAPKNIQWFSDFLKKAVERYDGDGIDDAPGSPIITYWQLDNEIDNQIYYKDTPSNYAKFLKIASDAIRQGNPEAKIILGSLANPRGMPYFEQLISILKNQKSFDIFDFHWYSEGMQTYKQHSQDKMAFSELIAKINILLADNGYKDVPLWITEAGDYAGEPRKPGGKKFSYQSEADQAASLFKLHVYALAHGVSKIFWTSLTDLNNYAGEMGGYFDNIGLINNPKNTGKSDKKTAYYTYGKLIELISGFSAGDISILKEGNVNVYRFGKGEKIVYLGWQDAQGDTSFTALPVINSNKVRIIKAIPVLKRGKPFFDTDYHEIKEGRFSYQFGTTPVFIVAE